MRGRRKNSEIEKKRVIRELGGESKEPILCRPKRSRSKSKGFNSESKGFISIRCHKDSKEKGELKISVNLGRRRPMVTSV